MNKERNQKMTVLNELKFLAYELSINPRIKSFVWRSAMMIIAGVIDIALQVIAGLELQSSVVVVAGLVLGEVSKYLNKKYNGA